MTMAKKPYPRSWLFNLRLAGLTQTSSEVGVLLAQARRPCRSDLTDRAFQGVAHSKGVDPLLVKPSVTLSRHDEPLQRPWAVDPALARGLRRGACIDPQPF